MSLASVYDLRRIADAVGHLRDRQVQDIVLRSDCRQLKLGLDDGQVLLITVSADEAGRPRLDADLLRSPEEAATNQLEVEFGGAD
ncbi:MAG: hypothetical protein OER21_03170 [Gemmatimonadota bacterium]|nr:hypothetical protein [Gemmatimonadota bacterium]